MTDFVRLERDGAVGIIRLDRPPVNAINTAIHHQLLAIVEGIADDPGVRAVVLHGGERTFAAGADIKELAGLLPAQVTELGGTLNAAFTGVARIGVPTIAAITGYALGAGCELALTADFRVMSEDAVLGLPEITLGVIPGAGGTQRLARLIGAAKAKELIFTGRSVRGADAVALGLATVAVPAAQVLPEALTMARRFAAGPTAALAAAKRVIDDGLDATLQAGLDLEGDRFAELFATDDARIGMESFVRQGPGKAQFTGR